MSTMSTETRNDTPDFEGHDTKPARVTISLSRKSVDRVERLAKRHDDTKTDTINRAIALYDLLEDLENAGGIYTRDEAGNLERLKLVR
jgi:hypothetical protein